ncbi:glycoside hydrolase domain-containing protein [Kribbella sp. NPDC005582]|uniref:glycoside hydrolase domain-containing protein n=1 Tax=Kribbella sp. NPDC005582 TaxID=3156893 RepID=UPI0033B797AC
MKLRWILVAALGASLLTPTAQTPTAQAVRPSAGGLSVWTESAYTSVFRDSRPSDESDQELLLDTARNDYEGAQIVVRRSQAFTITGVGFSVLSGPAGSIDAANLSYNFVDYESLNYNSPVTPLLRTGAGLFPDRLRNDPTIAVEPNSTQSIWIRAYIPAAAAGGLYTGTVTVRTTVGDIQVPITANVRDVLIPPTKDSEFTNVLWHNMLGPSSWDHGAGDTVEMYYNVKRYDDRWWQIVDNYAAMQAKYRGNSLQLPVIHLLREGGSVVDSAGNYQFNWTRFDQVVERIMRAGHIKRLEGFTMNGPHDDPRSPWYDPNRPKGKFLTEVLGKTDAGTQQASFSWVDWDSAPATKWNDQFFPALRAHLISKGWDKMWWHHVSDESGSPTWFTIERIIRARWPEVKIGDAFLWMGVDQAKEADVMIPILDEYDRHRDVYDKERDDKGKQLWLYNCIGPAGNFLNRFVDQPQWHQRMTMWYAYSRGVTGYLHWAWMNWQYKMNDQGGKGDGYIVRPDPARLTFESSPRYESLRDGIEDWEVLNILGKRNAGLAKELATSMAQRGDKYVMDTTFQQRIRRMALDAAAGLPVIAQDHARDKAATSSSSAGTGFEASKAVDGNDATGWRPEVGTQWLQVDLRNQSRLDGVHLKWSAAAAGNYRLKTSYDGTNWVDAYSTTTGDGGDDFIGFVGKARYLRLEVTGGSSAYQLNSLEVSGHRLGQANLAAGKTYGLVPAPDDQPDEGGRQLTDGQIGDDWSDKRGVGWKTIKNSNRYTDMTIDLGSVQRVAEAKVHAYEEYQHYRPDELSVLTSTDGTNYTVRKTVTGIDPAGQSKVWYDLAFPAVQARWVRISFNHRGTDPGTVTLMDELEVYGAGSAVGPEEPPGSGAFVWKHQNHVFTPDFQHRWYSPGIGVERDVWPGGPVEGKPVGIAFDNQQHVFARSKTNTLINSSWTEGQTAVQTADLGGEAYSDPAPVVWGNQRHVFARSADGGLTHWSWDAASGQQLNSWPKAPVPIAGKPSAFAARDELHVVARGTDNRLYHWWWKADAPAPQVEAWGGEAYSDPTTFTYDGQLHAFAKAADGQLFHWFADPGDGLHTDKWTGAPAGFQGTPAGYRYGNQQHVVARGADGTLYHWWWDQPTDKIQFANWGGKVLSDPLASVYNNQQHVFAQSATDTLTHWQADATGVPVVDQW